MYNWFINVHLRIPKSPTHTQFQITMESRGVKSLSCPFRNAERHYRKFINAVEYQE